MEVLSVIIIICHFYYYNKRGGKLTVTWYFYFNELYCWFSWTFFSFFGFGCSYMCFFLWIWGIICEMIIVSLNILMVWVIDNAREIMKVKFYVWWALQWFLLGYYFGGSLLDCIIYFFSSRWSISCIMVKMIVLFPPQMVFLRRTNFISKLSW